MDTLDIPAISVWKREYLKALILCLALYIPLTILILWMLLHKRHKNAGIIRKKAQPALQQKHKTKRPAFWKAGLFLY